MQEENQVAVFIDFENVAISAQDSYGQCDIGVIMEASEQWGRCIIRRAYGDWTRFDRYGQALLEHAIESIQMFPYGSQRRKNAADIKMAVDILETLFGHPEINVFVLVTGDSDFSAVARKLREYGNLVIGIGLRQATSEVLVNACDRFILYDTLVEPDTRSVTYLLERSRELLADTMRNLQKQYPGGRVLATQLKLNMLNQDPTFSELTLGFHQFRDFLEAQSDMVETLYSDNQLMVKLSRTAPVQTVQDETRPYRAALNAAGLRLIDPRTRVDILKDIYDVLIQNSTHLTIEALVSKLKAQYDADNVLRSREEVQEVARLLKYTDVLEPKPESWELDPLILRKDVDKQAFADRCEASYLVVLLENGLTIEPDQLALLLFGTSDQRERIKHLEYLATPRITDQAGVPPQAIAWEWPEDLTNNPKLQIALRDLEKCKAIDPISVERAADLNNEGLRIRSKDFEQAQGLFLKAARMMYDLMTSQAPGANYADLEWYLASYCAAAAGANFSRYDFSAATNYYLAFFVLAKEREPVWDRIQNLVPHMLSYYFTIAANRNNEWLPMSPGQTRPERLAIELYSHSNEKVREQWLELVQELANVNPILLRTVTQRLEVLEKEQQLPGARATREVLVRLVQSGGAKSPESTCRESDDSNGRGG